MKRIFSIILAGSIPYAHGSWFSQTYSHAATSTAFAAAGTAFAVALGALTGIVYAANSSSILSRATALKPLDKKVALHAEKRNALRNKINEQRDIIRSRKTDVKQEHEAGATTHQQQRDHIIQQQLDNLAPTAGTQNRDVFLHVIDTFFPNKRTSKQLFKNSKKGATWRTENGDVAGAQEIRAQQKQLTIEKSAIDKERRQLHAACTAWTSRSRLILLQGAAIILGALTPYLVLDMTSRIAHNRPLFDHWNRVPTNTQLMVGSTICTSFITSAFFGRELVSCLQNHINWLRNRLG